MLGNKFCQLYEPLVQYIDMIIIFTVNNNQVTIGKLHKFIM